MFEQNQHFYEFGPFRLDPLKRRLMRDGEVVRLTPKAFDLLLVLVEERGRTVEKDELSVSPIVTTRWAWSRSARCRQARADDVRRKRRRKRSSLMARVPKHTRH